MTDNHPITPPPELLNQWSMDFYELGEWRAIAIQAAQWGADQELEACCEWFVCDWTDIETADKLRSARRPKPPSLKQQALEALVSINSNFHVYGSDIETIRRALEALND